MQDNVLQKRVIICIALAPMLGGGISAAIAQNPLQPPMPPQAVPQPGIPQPDAPQPAVQQPVGPLESIFYSDKEVEKIRLAVLSYTNRGGTTTVREDFSAEEWFSQVGEIKQARSQDRYYTYPQFFLESLVFHTDTDWTVWLNGQRITPESKQHSSEIKVVGIDKNQVTLQWTPADFERVRKTWENNSNEFVMLDQAARMVSFVLKPNQTFSSYVMKVLEGKVLPVTVDNQEIEKDFQAKPIVLDNSPDVIQDIYSDSDATNNEKQPEANIAPIVPTQENPAELIGNYGSGEQKKE